jgi:hypothetical protein
MSPMEIITEAEIILIGAVVALVVSTATLAGEAPRGGDRGRRGRDVLGATAACGRDFRSRVPTGTTG